MTNLKKNFVVLTHYTFTFPVIKIFTDEIEAMNYFMKIVLEKVKTIKESGKDYDIIVENKYAKIITQSYDGKEITEFYLLEA